MAFPSALETVCSLQRLKWGWGGAAAFNFPPSFSVKSFSSSLPPPSAFFPSQQGLYQFTSRAAHFDLFLLLLLFHFFFFWLVFESESPESPYQLRQSHPSPHISHLATEILSHPVPPPTSSPHISLREKNSGVGYKSWESRYRGCTS